MCQRRLHALRLLRPALLGGVLSLLLLPCCTQEQQADCPRPVGISIRVVNVEGDDITEEGAIRNLSLYIFDNRQRFLKTIDAQMGESLSVYFPDQDTLHVVSWGNLSSEREQLPQLKAGTPMKEAVIRLYETKTMQTKATATAVAATAAVAVATSPDDLFYSYDVIALKSGNQTTYKLQMSRSVGSMCITMRHLQSWANHYDEHYSLLVRETYNGIDFYGRLTGDKVGYLPATSFDERQQFIAPLFNLLPSHPGGNIEIDVYHENTLITTVKSDSNKEPFRVLPGQVLNVLVNFKLTVSVEVGITPWGKVKVWKDF